MHIVHDFPPVIHEIYAIHMVLSRFGFDTKDIYVGFARIANSFVQEPTYVVRLRTQDKEFNIPIGLMPDHSEEQALELWGKFARLAKLASKDDLHECYRRTRTSTDAMMVLELIATIRKRGFNIPSAHGINVDSVAELLGKPIPSTGAGPEGVA